MAPAADPLLMDQEAPRRGWASPRGLRREVPLSPNPPALIKGISWLARPDLGMVGVMGLGLR